MYTILINDDHTFTHTNKTRIMHRSNKIESIQFLVNPTYNDLDIEQSNVVLEYVTPISREYNTIVLKKSEERYKNKVQFILPVTIDLTSEVGELELTINFSRLIKNDDDTFAEQVRTIGSTSIKIWETKNWSDYIADTKLDNIAQMMLTQQSLLEQQKVYAEMIAYEKADGIAKDEDTNEIYLTCGGKQIGQRIKDSDSLVDEGGIPTVDFGHESDDSGFDIYDEEGFDAVIL